jgi:membrane-associated PAP2 superfamily phosphatase
LRECLPFLPLRFRLSLTSCLWDLADFGRMAQSVSHWAWGHGDGSAGRCFPSGHASAGYAFLALAVPGLLSASALMQQNGRRIFFAVFLFGLVCGATQVLRGAHYPGHVLWTGLICWTVALANHLAFMALRGRLVAHCPAPHDQT